MELILASASPRRAGILRSLGIEAHVHPSEVEEAVLPGETPQAHAERLSRAKARTVSRAFPTAWILAGDTVVTAEGMILGKPRDAEHAVEMLLRLQGRDHHVYSALVLVRPPDAPDGRGPSEGLAFSGVEATRVRFRPFDRAVAEAYVRTGEPADKAGAYAIQGKGAALVVQIEGDYTGVVGLPVPLLVRLMEEAGRPYRFDQGTV